MRRDLQRYLAEMQKQMNQMQAAFDEAQEKALTGEISQEVAAQVAEGYNLVKSNYQRVLYCNYALNLPPKFIQKLQQRKLDRKLKEYKESLADEQSVKEENEKAIESVKEIAGDKDETKD